MSVAIARRRRYLGDGSGDNDLRFLFVKRSVTTAAQVIGCSELNEQSVVATNDFP